MILTEVAEKKVSKGLQKLLSDTGVAETNKTEIKKIGFKVDASSYPLSMITQQGHLSVVNTLNLNELNNEDKEKVYKIGDILLRELKRKGYIKSEHEYIRNIIRKYLSVSICPRSYKLITKGCY